MPKGYRREAGRYLLNSNPLIWHAVREVCYRHQGLDDALLSAPLCEQAPEMVAHTPYDLVLCDCQIPVMDG